MRRCTRRRWGRSRISCTGTLGRNWVRSHRIADPGRGREQGIPGMPAQVIGLVAHTGKPGAASLCGPLREEFRGEVRGGAHSRRRRRSSSAWTRRFRRGHWREECEILVALGGDGTILQVVHEMAEDLKPIFGINLGSLGFLTCVSSSACRKAVEAIVTGSTSEQAHACWMSRWSATARSSRGAWD